MRSFVGFRVIKQRGEKNADALARTLALQRPRFPIPIVTPSYGDVVVWKQPSDIPERDTRSRSGLHWIIRYESPVTTD